MKLISSKSKPVFILLTTVLSQSASSPFGAEQANSPDPGHSHYAAEPRRLRGASGPVPPAAADQADAPPLSFDPEVAVVPPCFEILDKSNRTAVRVNCSDVPGTNCYSKQGCMSEEQEAIQLGTIICQQYFKLTYSDNGPHSWCAGCCN
jgi:hypothetical protein